MDGIGGYINAYTCKEFTCYYITLLPENLEDGVDILFDAVFNSVHRSEDIALEKSIIGEEIKMYEDTPEEKIHDVFAQHVFESLYLGEPILGTASSLHRLIPTCS